MKYSFEEIKDLWKDHDDVMNCQQHIQSASCSSTVQEVIDAFKNNKTQRVIALTRPYVTFETFSNDIQLFNYLIKEHKELNFSYYPETGFFFFFRSARSKKHFDHSSQWKGTEIRSFNTMDLYEKCAEFKNTQNNKKINVWFDEINV